MPVQPADSLRLETSAPIAPQHLTGEALEHWNYLNQYLGVIGLLERVDLGAMSAACVAYAQALGADRHIDEHGIVVTNDKGNMHKNPACEVSHQAWSRYLLFAVEFGLTPASRSKIPQPKQETQDEFETFTKQA